MNRTVTDAADHDPLDASTGGTAAKRHRNVAAFLAQRGLEPAWLIDIMRQQIGDGTLILTSSPVHGLANPSSDLDFIRVQDDPMYGPRISTKIFERGHHLEVVSFSAYEVSRNLDELAILATKPPAEIVAGFRSWDSRFEPRRKQTERIVNGITLDGFMPYWASLPALGIVWSHASLQTAVEQVFHFCLAEAAGETRGRVGYAVNAILHLADALLSLQGDVYTTRKWYLLRWRRADLATTAHDHRVQEVAADIDLLLGEVRSLLNQPALRLAPPYIEIVTRVAQLVGPISRIAVTAELAKGAEYHEFLPGAGMLLGCGSAVMVTGRPATVSGRLEFGACPHFDAEPAADLLRALRAGLACLRSTFDVEPIR